MSSTATLSDSFTQALLGEDELGVVIRSQIHVEVKLNQLLVALAKNPSQIDRMQLDYFQRVNLAVVLGLDPAHAAPLLALGTLRNAFAHRLETRLTKDRVDNLYKTFAPEDRVIVQASFKRTLEQGVGEKGSSFRSLAPKVRFILMAVSLEAMVQAHLSHFVSKNAGA